MEWILSDERLPEDCFPVIAFGLNSCGKCRTIRAAYARKNELEASCDYDDFGEYDEATDTYYAPEGWYEWNENEETHWQVDFKITHWMPLPEAPVASNNGFNSTPPNGAAS